MLLVRYTKDDELTVTLTFQKSMRSVVRGGIVRVVFCVVRSNETDVEILPSCVMTSEVYQATSSDVVYSGKVTVVVLERF